MSKEVGMRWGDTSQHVIRRAADWFFRPRGPEKWICGAGVALLVSLNSANVYLKYQGPVGSQSASFEIGTGGAVPAAIYWIVTVLSVLLIVGSVALSLHRYRAEQRRLSKKKVLVIEARGLRDDAGAPLEAAVPASIKGSRTPLVVDVRQRKDGAIVDPDDLLPPVHSMKTWLHQMQRNSDREDLAVVYGGLAAVPITFLTGLLLDDEGSIVVMDWDRSEERWKGLDDPDDNARFSIEGLDAVRGASEVVVAVSVSYQVKGEDLATTFSFPVVCATLSEIGSSHWSQAKQSALADQLFGVFKQLDAIGVQQIHLVLAAQNSVVFNLGRRYDKRNLPKIAVYQFERGENTRYPWAIQMPVAGSQTASIMRPGNTHN